MTLLLPLLALSATAPNYALSSKEIDQKVNSIMKSMTLQEEIGQLVQFSNGGATGPDNVRVDQMTLIARGGLGSILNASGAKATNDLQRQAVEKSRLKIPLLFGLDVIHGYRTIFPVPLALSATWDTDLIERTARTAAIEATSEGVRWTFSPMVDIARDARWGRIMEGAGEDTYLGSKVAQAYVRGYQGKSLNDPTSMIACAKHFVAYGAVEAGREYNLVDISDRVLRDVYLPPFHAAVDAGAGTLMSAFNTVQGVPASANKALLTGVLRNEWGFNGFVVSDWASIGELIDHGVALNNREAAEKGMNAGVDMDMAANAYASELAGLVKSGKVKKSAVDEATRRILRVKVAIGLFDRPYTDEKLSPGSLLTPDHLALAREAAEKSFVLLKNDKVGGKPLLPLSSDKKVALVGPLADSQNDMLGEWSCRGRAEDTVTLRTALSGRLKGNLTYAKGTEVQTDSEAGFAEAIAAANQADVVIMAVGESRSMSGESTSRTKIGLPGNQLKLVQAIAATGKPIVLVSFSGRPLALPWEAANLPAILEAWMPGDQAGPALAQTLYGEAEPMGRLTTSFPRSVGQEPLYYNHFSTGRPVPADNPYKKYTSMYLDELTTPLFPFGFGLSYTHFDYSATRVTSKPMSLKSMGMIEVEATVTNTGLTVGHDVPQLYICERGTSVARPVRELKGFERIKLQPGESRVVKFSLTAKDLAFYNIDMKHVAEPCELTIWIAPNSASGTPAVTHLVE